MVGERIKELRIESGKSLRGLAKIADISSTTLSDVENNKTNPSVVVLEKLATALQVEVGTFFKKEDKKKLKSYAIKMIEQILEENIIKDPENIPLEIIDLIISCLKKDIKKSTN